MNWSRASSRVSEARTPHTGWFPVHPSSPLESSRRRPWSKIESCFVHLFVRKWNAWDFPRWRTDSSYKAAWQNKSKFIRVLVLGRFGTVKNLTLSLIILEMQSDWSFDVPGKFGTFRTEICLPGPEWAFNSVGDENQSKTTWSWMNTWRINKSPALDTMRIGF